MLGAYLIFGACQNPNTSTSEPAALADSLSAKVCYLCFTEKLQEFVWFNTAFSGEGQGYYSQQDKHFTLTFKGQKTDNTLKMEVKRNMTTTQQTEIDPETWTLTPQGDWLVLEKPNGEKGMVYRKIRCPDAPEAEGLYDEIQLFREGVAIMRKGKYYGAIDTNKKELIPPIYGYLGHINEGSLIFKDSNEVISPQFGVLDIKGQVLIPAKYQQISFFSEGKAAFLDPQAGKWGFMDRTGKVVIAPQFEQVFFVENDPTMRPFQEGLAAVVKNGKWGFIDEKGKTVIPFQYLIAQSFINGEARVNKDNSWFYINKSGACVKNCQ